MRDTRDLFLNDQTVQAPRRLPIACIFLVAISTSLGDLWAQAANEVSLIYITAWRAEFKSGESVIGHVEAETLAVREDFKNGHCQITAEMIDIKTKTKRRANGWLLAKDIVETRWNSSKELKRKESNGLYARAKRLLKDKQSAEGLELAKQAFEVGKEAWGADHPIATYLKGLVAEAQHLQSNLEEAAKLYRECLDAHAKSFGPRHPNTAGAMAELADVYDDMWRENDALKLYQEALAIRRALQGDEDEATIVDIYYVARTHKHLKNYTEAEGLYVEGLNSRSKHGLGTSEAFKINLKELADLYLQASQYDKALERYYQLADLDKYDIDILGALHTIADAYAHTGELTKAEEIYRKGIELALARGVTKHEESIALAAKWLADFYASTGQPERVEAVYTSTINRFQRKPYRELGTLWLYLAEYYQKQNRSDEAHEIYTKLFASLLEAEQPEFTLIRTVIDAGLDHADKTLDATDAASIMDKYIELAKEHPGFEGANLSDAYNMATDRAKAKLKYREAIEWNDKRIALLKGEDPKHYMLSVLQSEKVDFLLLLGEYRQSIPELEHLIQQTKNETADEYEWMPPQLRLANVNALIGESARASDLCIEILARAETDPNRVREMPWPSAIMLLARLGNRFQAKKYLQIAEREWLISTAATAVAHNRMTLAQILRELGENDRVFDLLVQARDGLWNDGKPECQCWYTASLELAKQRHRRGESAAARADLLDLLSHLEQEVVVEATNVIDPVESDRYETTVEALAKVYEANGELALAKTWYEREKDYVIRTLGRQSTKLAHVLWQLAVVCDGLHELEQARTYLHEARRIYETIGTGAHPELAQIVTQLATVQDHAGEIGRATDSFELARATVRRHTTDVLPALSSGDQLSFLADMDSVQLNTAIDFARRHASDGRLRALSAGWVLNAKGVSQEALAESALFSSSEVAPKVRELRAVRAERARTTLALDDAHGESSSETANLEKHENDLMQTIATAGVGRRADNPWCSIGELQQKLPENGLFVSIFRALPPTVRGEVPAAAPAAPIYVAWLVPALGKGDIQLVELGDANPIDQAVHRVRKLLVGAPESIHTKGELAAHAEIEIELRALSQMLVPRLGEQLLAAEKLIISPDGDLWLLPFEALLVEAPLDPRKDSTGNREPAVRYLVENHTISYVSSGRELIYERPRRNTTTAVIVADPDFDLKPEAIARKPSEVSEFQLRGVANQLPATVERLPGFAKEGHAIGVSLERYTHNLPQSVTGAEASETCVKGLSRPRILVLTTHGFSLPDAATSPLLRCGLLLAGFNRRNQINSDDLDDGVLTGLEIVGIDLRGTELVVLSACDTANGQVQSGEGVAGLRQAFQLAGAKAVAGSLWPVSDQATQILMTEFFNHLAGDDASVPNSTNRFKSTALASAQRSMIEAYRLNRGVANPYYWAAFTISGD